MVWYLWSHQALSCCHISSMSSRGKTSPAVCRDSPNSPPWPKSSLFKISSLPPCLLASMSREACKRKAVASTCLANSCSCFCMLAVSRTAVRARRLTLFSNAPHLRSNAASTALRRASSFISNNGREDISMSLVPYLSALGLAEASVEPSLSARKSGSRAVISGLESADTARLDSSHESLLEWENSDIRRAAAAATRAHAARTP
mmetsp:Transcript_111938/g.357308  ORF Transcript_111938/g.357308 Transcript_111938/m.357308 type:complete len:204 (+) Transcript_111938:816-1427(+)